MTEVNELTPVTILLEEHPLHESVVIFQTGSDLWIGERDDNAFITGYWPATDTGLAEARATLCQIN